MSDNLLSTLMKRSSSQRILQDWLEVRRKDPYFALHSSLAANDFQLFRESFAVTHHSRHAFLSEPKQGLNPCEFFVCGFVADQIGGLNPLQHRPARLKPDFLLQSLRLVGWGDEWDSQMAGVVSTTRAVADRLPKGARTAGVVSCDDLAGLLFTARLLARKDPSGTTMYPSLSLPDELDPNNLLAGNVVLWQRYAYTQENVVTVEKVVGYADDGSPVIVPSNRDLVTPGTFVEVGYCAESPPAGSGGRKVYPRLSYILIVDDTLAQEMWKAARSLPSVQGNTATSMRQLSVATHRASSRKRIATTDGEEDRRGKRNRIDGDVPCGEGDDMDTDLAEKTGLLSVGTK